MRNRDEIDGDCGGERRPDLSVVIINWNTRDLLGQCLGSISEHIGRLTCEVLVVDNASHDGSARMVVDRFPEVDLIRNTRNLGFAKATNQALTKTRGRFVLLLNPDTRVKSGSVRRMTDFLDARPEVGVVGCQLLNPNGTIQPSFGRFPDLCSQFIYQSYLFKLIPSGLPVGSTPHRWQIGQYSTMHEVDWVTGACLMFRHELLGVVGLLDECIFMYAEDVDWCLRAARQGYKVFYLPQAQVIHHFGAGAKQDYSKWILNYVKGSWHFFQKHRSQPVRWCFAGFVIAGSSLRWVLWAMLGSLDRARSGEARQRREGYRQAIGWLLNELFSQD